ncbi:MAG: CDP-alcohol phosphatidyltransferase family protein [Thermoanaerobaculia bacterium]|jgi:Phosphatidylglycerophosphate synthase|nr:CDP-alcohol phosphatidyltransferase family protein [Thermoanaerobaculia bacterium]
MELRPWTLPNLLTFARLVAIPFLINAVLEGQHGQAFAIFFAMAVSDFVDGYLARHFGMASPLGALLDPAADKLLLVSTFIVFALKSTPSNIHIPLWLVLLTVARDVLIVVVALVMALGLGIKSFPPTFLGKANTFAEISTVVAILMNNIGRMPSWVADACFVATFLLTIASGVHYVFRASSAIAGAAPGGPPTAGESPPGGPLSP